MKSSAYSGSGRPDQDSLWRMSWLPASLRRFAKLAPPALYLRDTHPLFLMLSLLMAFMGVLISSREGVTSPSNLAMMTSLVLTLGTWVVARFTPGAKRYAEPVLLVFISAFYFINGWFIQNDAHNLVVACFSAFMVGTACYISHPLLLVWMVLAAWFTWGLRVDWQALDGLWPIATVKLAATFASITIYTQRSRAWRRLQALSKEGEGARFALQRAVDHAAASEASLSALIENTDDVVWAVDSKHAITAANRALRRLLRDNFQLEVKVGEDLLRDFNPKMQERWRTRYRRALGGEHILIEESYKLDGETTHFEVSLAPIRSGNHITGISIIGRDVTRRKKIESALRESQQRYALAAEGSNDSIWDWDLQAKTIYLSKRWNEMLGYEGEPLEENPDEWLKRIHPDDVQRVSAELSAHLNGRDAHFQSEHRVRHRDGSYRWFLTRGLAVRDEDGTAYRIAGSHTDITEQKRVQEKLLTDAFTDSLTGLPNRALFVDRLGQVMRRAERGGHESYAVLFIDIDRFKVVNESLGHAMGDQLLIDIAVRLQECVRPGDTVARFGGDEFAVLLEEIAEKSDASQVASRIKQVLSTPFSLRGQEVFSSASIGITVGHDQYTSPQDVMRDADSAVYRAKAKGKARYEFFQTGMYTNALALLSLENDLRRALEREEFALRYQPIVDLEEGRAVGFEALVRWQHPERGLISPAAFITVAEETGVIMPLGRWVIKQACEQLVEWSKQEGYPPGMYVSVNLSARQLVDHDLLPHIREVLGRTGLEPQRLRLEITESAIIDNDDAVAKVLEELRELNLQLYLDDFGTGYSSLSYLHRLPVDAIKIDRSFVIRLSPQASDPGVVQTIISLAKVLNMSIVAEGVETAWQRSTLKELGCRYAQGYLFAEPLDATAVRGWVEHYRAST